MEASPDRSVREDWGSGTAGDRSVRTMEGQLTGFPTDADPEPEEKWGNEQICLVRHPIGCFQQPSSMASAASGSSQVYQ